MRNLKKESLRHHNRIRSHIINNYNLDKPVNPAILKIEIAEDWSGTYCPYCGNDCDKCNLHTDNGCCDGYWYKMDMSDTWKKWLKWNKKLIKFVKKFG